MEHNDSDNPFFRAVLAAVLAALEAELRDIRQKNTKISGTTHRIAPLSSAAVKRAKVAFVDQYLKKSGLDLTITMSEKVFLSALGRSVSQKNKGKYATPGRTAAEKSVVSDSQVANLAARIRPGLTFLLEEIESIKYKVQREHYQKVTKPTEKISN